MTLLRKCVLTFLIALPGLAGAQRLPLNVVPENYDLTFTPDLAKAAFTGVETIQVKVLKPTTSITLNATELQFASVAVIQGDLVQPAQATFAPEKEQVTLAVAQEIQAGPASIRIECHARSGPRDPGGSGQYSYRVQRRPQ